MNVERAKQRFYKEDQYNNDRVFIELIETSLTPDMRVLDAGAGAGDAFPYDIKDSVRELVGVDLDPRVESNPRLHRGIVSDLMRIPCEDESFDLVFSRYVLEHVADPQAFLAEMRRILKPGGTFLFLTPNKWHYVSIAARLTPHAFHTWYNRKRGRADDDTFETLFRLNSARDLRREFRRAGFEERRIILRECCPNYLTFSLPSFLLGALYERLVNRFDVFKVLRVNIIGEFVKSGSAAAD